ncbi:hypothetical protein ABZ470_39560 [Streptosporangium sp. NPDC020072]|uniref:hypothetical protein n=1 Tax=Streptosporangium sp. NPDC020072 TaxID=3154788 RepID=UPI00342843E9
MPQIWTIWDVELSYGHTDFPATGDAAQVLASGGEPVWGVYEVGEDTTAYGISAVPHSLLEWRSAEYDIDPADLDTLIDVALHERFIPHPADALAWADEQAGRVLQASADLPTCWTPGVSGTDRRQAHLERVRLVKDHLVRLEAASRADRQGALAFVGSARVAPPDPLQPMREGIQLDPARVEAKKLAVAWKRARGDLPAAAVKPPATFMGVR